MTSRAFPIKAGRESRLPRSSIEGTRRSSRLLRSAHPSSPLPLHFTGRRARIICGSRDSPGLPQEVRASVLCTCLAFLILASFSPSPKQGDLSMYHLCIFLLFLPSTCSSPGGWLGERLALLPLFHLIDDLILGHQTTTFAMCRMLQQCLPVPSLNITTCSAQDSLLHPVPFTSVCLYEVLGWAGMEDRAALAVLLDLLICAPVYLPTATESIKPLP